MKHFLLVMLLGLTVVCGGTATATPASPVKTPVPTGTSPLKTSLQPEPTAPVNKATTTPPSPSVTSNTPTSTPVASPGFVPEIATPPVETSSPIEGPVVKLENIHFSVDLALTVEQQIQGLSGREVLAPGTGMLFVYQAEARHVFWMKEMRFPLDIVWIGADCTVVDVTLGAPPPEPGQTLDQLPRFAPADPVQYVLEINAGEFVAGGIGIGDPVEFAGDLTGRYGC